MKVRPLHDRLLVHRIEEKERARGGIIIPDTAREKPCPASPPRRLGTEAGHVAAEVLDAVRAPFRLDGHEVSIVTSVPG